MAQRVQFPTFLEIKTGDGTTHQFARIQLRFLTGNFASHTHEEVRKLIREAGHEPCRLSDALRILLTLNSDDVDADMDILTIICDTVHDSHGKECELSITWNRVTEQYQLTALCHPANKDSSVLWASDEIVFRLRR